MPDENKRFEETVKADLEKMEKEAQAQPGIYDLMVAYGAYDHAYETMEKAYSMLNTDSRRVTTTASTSEG